MRVNNDGAHIDVRIDGSAGSPVVLLAGFPLTREIWNATARGLAAAHRVVMPDLRGTGASNVPPGPYLMETLAGDVAAVLDALGIERATLVGHSLGGYVALAFARMYAERVASLALVCSRLAADTSERAMWRNDLAERAERDGSVQAIIDAMVPLLLAERTHEQHPEIERLVREIAATNDVRGLCGLLRGMALRDPADDIAPDLEMPVLVAAGGADPLISLEESREIAMRFPQGTLEIFPASGHLPMLEEPDRLTELLGAFAAGASE